jgi:DNA replication protein DnaC
MDNLQETLERIKSKWSQNQSSTEQNSDTKVNCRECNDIGFIMIDDRNAIPCKCWEMAMIENLFKSSQITPAFRKKTFDAFDTAKTPNVVRKMYDCAKHYADHFHEVTKKENNWLVLLGEPGSGKTHLSMAVSNVLLSQKIPVLYFQHVEGMKEFVSIVSQSGDISPKKEQMKQVDVLYWDDLFKPPKNPSAFDIELAFEVLNYRYLNLKPTIISSEHNMEQLLQIDKALGSRIIERGKEFLVEVNGIECNYRIQG